MSKLSNDMFISVAEQLLRGRVRRQTMIAAENDRKLCEAMINNVMKVRSTFKNAFFYTVNSIVLLSI